MNLVDKIGTVTIRTTNGLMQIYVKNDEALIALIRKDLVTYIDMYSVDEMMSPLSNILYRFLPNRFSLTVLAKNIISSKIISIQNHYNDDEKILKLKKGKKYSDYSISTANNDKVENLFAEFEKNSEIFKGFCNYKIDGLGNITDIELDLLRKSFDTKYSIESYVEDSGKDDSTEKFLKKIFKTYLKENKQNIGDIKKIEFEKAGSEFDNVSNHQKDSQEDFLYYLISQKKNIESRLSDIGNIKSYINDSRIEDIYTDEEIALALSEVYIREKIENREDKQEILEILGKSYVDKKLINIIGEDMVMSSKKMKRKNFEDFISIKYLRNMAYIKNCTEQETDRAIKVLKRYVEVVQSYDFLGKHDEISDVQRDELAIIMRNYEKFICSGLLNKFGINSVCLEDVKFLNILKGMIIKEKTQYDDMISFTVRKDIVEKEDPKEKFSDDSMDSKNKILFTYITKDKQVHILKDNKLYKVEDEEEEKKKYIEHEESFKNKSKLSAIICKGNFAYVEDNLRIHIDREHQQEELSLYEERMNMTNDIIDELLERRKNAKSELTLIEEIEVKKFQQLLDDGDIESIIDYVQISKSKKEMADIDIIVPTAEEENESEEKTSENVELQ